MGLLQAKKYDPFTIRPKPSKPQGGYFVIFNKSMGEKFEASSSRNNSLLKNGSGYCQPEK